MNKKTKPKNGIEIQKKMREIMEQQEAQKKALNQKKK
jgi:hypothetical protein